MPVQDKPELGQIATVPDNLNQPPKFGAITELVKDAFVLELRHFLDVSSTRLRDGEFPRIDKYSVALDTTVDPLETAVSLIRNYPDIAEDLPLIAVMATTGSNLKLDIANQHMDLVVDSASLTGTVDETFTLVDGDTLIVTTIPSGKPTEEVESTFTFRPFMFVDIANATAKEVADAINLQALYVTASAVGGKVLLRAGGPRGNNYPNHIEITGGTSLAALGFVLSDINKNYGPGNTRVMARKYIAATLTVGLEVVAESENVRTDIADLLFDFLTFVMEDRSFTFYGRSTFDSSVADETYQIILKNNEISLSGEQEAPRTGDQKDKIYINRVNVPIIAIQYSDRVIYNNPPASTTILQADFDIPEPN